MSIFDEFRGMVIDLPVGEILPGWVSKEAVIRAIDRLEQGRAAAHPECPECAAGGHRVPSPHLIAVE